MSEARITPRGGASPTSIIVSAGAPTLPLGADVVAALEGQRARILRRTEAGKDVEGRAFAEYNRTRPYYWYPAGKVGRRRSSGSELRRDKAAITRALKKAGTGRTSRSGLGIRFESYDHFKRSGLGRSHPDLRGPRAPHMLQSLAIRVSAGEDQPCSEGRLGIYGEAAARAMGHNAESGRPKGMPRREFLGASDSDQRDMATDIEQRAAARERERLGA